MILCSVLQVVRNTAREGNSKKDCRHSFRLRQYTISGYYVLCRVLQLYLICLKDVVPYVFHASPFLQCMELWCLLSVIHGAMASFVYPSHIHERKLISSTLCNKN